MTFIKDVIDKLDSRTLMTVGGLIVAGYALFILQDVTGEKFNAASEKIVNVVEAHNKFTETNSQDDKELKKDLVKALNDNTKAIQDLQTFMRTNR